MAQLARHGVDTAAFRPEATPAAQAVEAWLTRYAAGSREQFALPRKLYGTPFQIAVWEALEALGYDEVISYAELARRVGSNGFRAVGTAVGHNPIPIIIPCHRIVRQDGVIGRVRRRERHRDQTTAAAPGRAQRLNKNRLPVRRTREPIFAIPFSGSPLLLLRLCLFEQNQFCFGSVQIQFLALLLRPDQGVYRLLCGAEQSFIHLFIIRHTVHSFVF